ncbi:MAG: hypothetical protein JWO43_23 [Candidatus Adlerbacteria bacterium]|nr:hypothetical protein [Candidatus Adlerbacteria bacterium]
MSVEYENVPKEIGTWVKFRPLLGKSQVPSDKSYRAIYLGNYPLRWVENAALKKPWYFVPAFCKLVEGVRCEWEPHEEVDAFIKLNPFKLPNEVSLYTAEGEMGNNIRITSEKLPANTELKAFTTSVRWVDGRSRVVSSRHHNEKIYYLLLERIRFDEQMFS